MLLGLEARVALRALCSLYFRIIYEYNLDSYFIIILMTCPLKDGKKINWAQVSLTTGISQTVQK